MNLFKMKCHLLGLVLLILSGKPLSGQSTALFDDTKVASIYLELPADSLSYILNNLEHNRYLDTLTRFIAIPVYNFPSGVYVLHLVSGNKEARFVFLKGD